MYVCLELIARTELCVRERLQECGNMGAMRCNYKCFLYGSDVAHGSMDEYMHWNEQFPVQYVVCEGCIYVS